MLNNLSNFVSTKAKIPKFLDEFYEENKNNLYKGQTRGEIDDETFPLLRKCNYLPLTDEGMETFLPFINPLVNAVNDKFYQYQIDSFELPAIIVYEPGDYYGWHIDSWGQVGKDEQERKLSYIIQLSDPKDYTGGQVELKYPNGMDILPKKRGTICVFNSTITHRVRKIKKGKRLALVGWCVGPCWR